MTRPHVSAFIAASLDGFIAREDGSIDFLDCVNTPGEDYGFADYFSRIDTIVLGRTTWETVQAFSSWPFTGRRVVVMTHRTLPAKHNEAVHAGQLVPLLTQLYSDGARNVYVDGGHVIRQALAENVIDQLTLSTIPVLLGRGLPLFGEAAPRLTFDLVNSRAWPSGLVQNTWRVREVPPA